MQLGHPERWYSCILSPRLTYRLDIYNSSLWHGSYHACFPLHLRFQVPTEKIIALNLNASKLTLKMQMMMNNLLIFALLSREMRAGATHPSTRLEHGTDTDPLDLFRKECAGSRREKRRGSRKGDTPLYYEAHRSQVVIRTMRCSAHNQCQETRCKLGQRHNQAPAHWIPAGSRQAHRGPIPIVVGDACHIQTESGMIVCSDGNVSWNVIILTFKIGLPSF